MSEESKASIGKVLAAAREARGMTVADVAEKLKLTSAQVQAIERGDFARLPGAVFARGFVRNYARLMEVPAEDLLAQLAQDTGVTETETITAPSAGVRFSTSPMHRWLLLPLAALGLFLLLVVGLYLWLSRGEEAYLPTTVQGPTPTQQSLPLGPPMMPVPPAPEPQSATPAAVAISPEGAPVESGPSPSAPVESPPAAVPAPAAPPAPAAAVDGSGAAASAGAPLLLTAEEEAWVEVVSADNKRFSKRLQAGERLSVRGNPPFELVVGNAAHVQLNYKNKVIDLKPFTGKTVARLTLE